MRRSRGSIIYRFGNIVSGQRADSLVKIVSRLLVTTVTDHCKVCFHHARFDIRHPQRRIHQVYPKSVRKCLHSSFGGAVNTASGIGGISGDRTYINNVSAPPFHHARNYQTCHGEQTSYIRIDHDIPLVQTTFELFVHSDHQSGIVNQYINRFPFFRQRFQCGGSLFPVANIKRQHTDLYSILFFQFSLQFFQLRHCTGIQNQVPSFLSKFTGASFADSAARSGYKNNLRFHYVLNYNIE